MKSSTSASKSLKRSSLSSKHQKMSCLVDGCKSDLGKCRDYYRRHRVCENHSKDPLVIVGDEEQRFCQQCSRFHGLGEFDEEKRSCRKRLDGHNRRRRKSRPKSWCMSPAESILGSTILQFSDVTPTMVYNSSEHMDDLVVQLWPRNPLACINTGEKRDQFTVLRTNDHELINQVNPMVSVCSFFADGLASREAGRRSHRMPDNGVNQSIDCYCAHSLLSPLISLQPDTVHSIAQVSTNHCDICKPFSPILISERNQINQPSSSNIILHAWPHDFLDDEASITYK